MCVVSPVLVAPPDMRNAGLWRGNGLETEYMDNLLQLLEGFILQHSTVLRDARSSTHLA